MTQIFSENAYNVALKKNTESVEYLWAKRKINLQYFRIWRKNHKGQEAPR